MFISPIELTLPNENRQHFNLFNKCIGFALYSGQCNLQFKQQNHFLTVRICMLVRPLVYFFIHLSSAMYKIRSIKKKI